MELKERLHVENTLSDQVICRRCDCTLSTYDDECLADLLEICEGFNTIENALATFDPKAVA